MCATPRSHHSRSAAVSVNFFDKVDEGTAPDTPQESVESDFAFFALTADPCEECMRAQLAKMGIWNEDLCRIVVIGNDRSSLAEYGTEVHSLFLKTAEEIRTNILHDMFMEGKTCECSHLSNTNGEGPIDSPPARNIHDITKTRTSSGGKIQMTIRRLSSLILATRKTDSGDRTFSTAELREPSIEEVLTSNTENNGGADESSYLGAVAVPGSYIPGASTLARALEVDEAPSGLEDVEPQCPKAADLPVVQSSEAEGLDVLRGSLIVATTNPMYMSVDFLQDKPPSPIKKGKSTMTRALHAMGGTRSRQIRPSWRETLLTFKFVRAAKMGRSITTPKSGRGTWAEVDTFFAETAELRSSIIEEAKPCLRRRLAYFTGGALFKTLSDFRSSVLNGGFCSMQRIRSGSRWGQKENKEEGAIGSKALKEAVPAAIRGSTRILHPLFEPGSDFHMRSGRKFVAEADRGSIPFGRI